MLGQVRWFHEQYSSERLMGPARYIESNNMSNLLKYLLSSFKNAKEEVTCINSKTEGIIHLFLSEEVLWRSEEISHLACHEVHTANNVKQVELTQSHRHLKSVLPSMSQ